jgi:hypothetical protein
VTFSGAWATIGSSTGSINSFANCFAVNMSDPRGGSDSTSNPPVQSSTAGPYEPGGSTSSSFTVTYGVTESVADLIFANFASIPGAGASASGGNLAANGSDMAEGPAALWLPPALNQPSPSVADDLFPEAVGWAPHHEQSRSWLGDDPLEGFLSFPSERRGC